MTFSSQHFLCYQDGGKTAQFRQSQLRHRTIDPSSVQLQPQLRHLPKSSKWTLTWTQTTSPELIQVCCHQSLLQTSASVCCQPLRQSPFDVWRTSHRRRTPINQNHSTMKWQYKVTLSNLASAFNVLISMNTSCFLASPCHLWVTIAQMPMFAPLFGLLLRFNFVLAF